MRKTAEIVKAFALYVTLILIGMLAGAAIAGKPAHADTGITWKLPHPKVTMIIEEHLSGSYDRALRSSVTFIDKYTSSKVVYGKCTKPQTQHCIIIRTGSLKKYGKNFIGYTVKKNWIANITVKPGFGSYYSQRALLDHELGHAYGLGHARKCNTRMYPYIYCHGHLLPRIYTLTERHYLAKV